MKKEIKKVAQPTSPHHGGQRENAGRWMREIVTEIVARPNYLRGLRGSHWDIILDSVISASQDGHALQIKAKSSTIRVGLMMARKRRNLQILIHVRTIDAETVIAWIDK